MAQDSPADDGPGPVQGHPVLQWVMAGIGLCGALFAVGVTINEAARPERPPEMTARVTQVRPVPGGWALRVRLANAGDQTAAAVHLTARQAGREVLAVVDYVPREGFADATLVVPQNPAAAPAEVAVTGWSEP